MGKLSHRKDVRRQDIITVKYAGPRSWVPGLILVPLIIMCASLDNFLTLYVR